MSRTFHNGERRIRVRGIRREQPDLRRLARALIEFARAEAERDAEAEARRSKQRSASKRQKPEDPDSAPTGDAA